MRNKLESEIIVTHSMGGMMEFDRTGIYSNTLRIKSNKLNHTWRVKVNENRHPYVLKIKGSIVYQYAFDESGFSIQEVVNGIMMPASLNVMMITVMKD
jgi:hypothetical protein